MRKGCGFWRNRSSWASKMRARVRQAFKRGRLRRR